MDDSILILLVLVISIVGCFIISKNQNQNVVFDPRSLMVHKISVASIVRSCVIFLKFCAAYFWTLDYLRWFLSALVLGLSFFKKEIFPLKSALINQLLRQFYISRSGFLPMIYTQYLIHVVFISLAYGVPRFIVRIKLTLMTVLVTFFFSTPIQMLIFGQSYQFAGPGSWLLTLIFYLVTTNQKIFSQVYHFDTRFPLELRWPLIISYAFVASSYIEIGYPNVGSCVFGLILGLQDQPTRKSFFEFLNDLGVVRELFWDFLSFFLVVGRLPFSSSLFFKT
eukprot:GHVP01002905.1.p1 GENE.GHVP01002905.1~~GHVP01002905.1.p1  ORF type:complete len:280 (-),score=26.61 GHVP01002905.1:653-1492(-)